MTGIPLGDIELFDDYRPSLQAGNWYLELDHAVIKDGQTINSAPLGAVQEVIVTAPQFAIDATEILTRFPPDGSTGLFDDVLPHVVLSEPMLPWERNAGSDTAPQPWIALLVLASDEIVGAEGSPTRVTSTTVGAFLAPQPAGRLTPTVQREGDVSDDEPMSYVELPVSVFASIAPRLDELRYLAHCRQVNADDKAIAGLSVSGLFSVVVANRFPATPASGQPPTRTIVHLVSLEGLAPYLVSAPDWGGYTTVALVSLASWSFFTQPDGAEDFATLAKALVTAGKDPRTGDASPDLYRLRLSSASVAKSDPAGVEAAKRLDDGFVPLEYVTRSAERTFAFYRGPLVPHPVPPLVLDEPFATADAAIAYQPAYGIFDLSLAAAFEAGRLAALSDKAFGQRLLDFRRRGHAFTDALYERLTADHFGASDIETLSGATVQDELRALLKTDVLRDLGQQASNPLAPVAPANPDDNPKDALAAMLARPDTQQALSDAVSVDLDPVATWLGRLLLFYQVPFHFLVADTRMLPPESVRFFYVDPNWLDAALAGAASIGLESTRDTFFHQIVGDLVRDAAYDVLETFRENLPGVGPPPPATKGAPITGVLLRSQLVAGWPTLAVRPCDGTGAMMKTLRMDHLSPTVLLCLFSGTPVTISFCEPQEAFAFGLQEDSGTGYAGLRNLLPSKGDIGAELGPTLAVRDHSGASKLLMRAAGSRVLDLDPTAPGGLVQSLGTAVQKAGGASSPALGPADFALQMVDAPEAIAFNTPSLTLT